MYRERAIANRLDEPKMCQPSPGSVGARQALLNFGQP